MGNTRPWATCLDLDLIAILAVLLMIGLIDTTHENLPLSLHQNGNLRLFSTVTHSSVKKGGTYCLVER